MKVTEQTALRRLEKKGVNLDTPLERNGVLPPPIMENIRTILFSDNGRQPRFMMFVESLVAKTIGEINYFRP